MLRFRSYPLCLSQIMQPSKLMTRVLGLVLLIASPTGIWVDLRRP
jgi:hypothetical protein